MERVSELTSFNPSAILGFENKGLIKEGYDADLFLFDPLKHSDVGEFSPYKNIVLTGAVTHTFKAGELIYEL
jgi:dihydroorotase-like cyclic amidohydrolase